MFTSIKGIEVPIGGVILNSIKRSLERGFRITASEGIPEYNPLKDKHATYAHTEHYREEIRRLKSFKTDVFI